MTTPTLIKLLLVVVICFISSGVFVAIVVNTDRTLWGN